MKPISRATGRSAVGSAAYRCAEKLTNKRDGITHDYTRKQGVEHSEIVLPEGSNADWARDRSELWNAAEAAEKRKDAQLSREVESAIYDTLPHQIGALLREHPLQCPVAFVGGLASVEMKQAGGLDSIAELTQGRVMMLDGSHLFPMEKPLATAAAVEASLRGLDDSARGV